MSVAISTGRKKGKDPVVAPRSAKRERKDDGDFDPDLDLSSDIKGIISALQQIKEKALKDGQKQNEETIGTVASEVRSMLDEGKSRIEKERQTYIKAISKTAKEFEGLLKNEQLKYQSTYDKFCKDKTAHVQALKEIFFKFEDEKDKMFTRYEQQRKKEKATIAELEKACADKIAAAEDSLKKKKQDDRSFSILKKSLGSFLDNGSDDDFGSDG